MNFAVALLPKRPPVGSSLRRPPVGVPTEPHVGVDTAVSRLALLVSCVREEDMKIDKWLRNQHIGPDCGLYIGPGGGLSIGPVAGPQSVPDGGMSIGPSLSVPAVASPSSLAEACRSV